jgi:hypothetical protein
MIWDRYDIGKSGPNWDDRIAMQEHVDSITEKLKTAIEVYEQHKASESSRGALWGHEYEDHPGDRSIDIGRE